MTEDPHRLILAAGALLFLLATCIICLWPRRRTIAAASRLVLYASQTGQAEELARSAATRLDAACVSLRDVTADTLAAAELILCVASTTGDGDAPDDALAFERGLMRQSPDLSGKRFAVLALGDRKYDNFCAFGRRLYDWLAATGAQPLAPCFQADDLDPATLGQWEELLATLGAVAAEEAIFEPWRLTARERLNPLGEMPLFRLRFESGTQTWQAGDLAEILTPDGHRRDYSIASLPADGGIELYVRAIANGAGSTLLTRDLGLGDTVPLRLKSHAGFHAPDGEPVLMIAAGSGLAGLRAHIFQAERPGWLIYGERHPVRDGALCAAARTWPLVRLDLAFSQPDDGAGQYVQDLVTVHADAIRGYLGANGAIMVCGGLAMGQAVDAALRSVLGNDWVGTALAQKRYKRDLY